MNLTIIAPSLRRLTLLALVGVLAVPASSPAQGAGDDQYRDPFADTPAQSAQGEPAATTGEGLSERPPDPGPASEPQTPAAQEDDDGVATTPSEGNGNDDRGDAASAPELPLTGDDPWLVALVGGFLLLVGAGLRLRGGAHRRR